MRMLVEASGWKTLYIKEYEKGVGVLNFPITGIIARICPNITSLPLILKLETISRALWGRDFQPSQTERDLNLFGTPGCSLHQIKDHRMNDDFRGCPGSLLVRLMCDCGVSVFLIRIARSSYADAYIGFRLCQKRRRKAEIFGKQLSRSGADYPGFQFSLCVLLK